MIDRAKALWLAYLNADGVHGWKLELGYTLGQHGIDICLFTYTRLKSGEAFLMATMLVTVPTGYLKEEEEITSRLRY